jgi:hypothetical protein
MRYYSKFIGDDITEKDLVPIALDDLVLDVPRPASKLNELRDLPIRVKTRFRGGPKSARRRVVSTPIFDLVTPAPWDLEEPPRTFEHDPSNPELNKPFKRKDNRSLPSLPKNTKRQISMPIHLSHTYTSKSIDSQMSQTSESSYTNIIQFYKDNAPFAHPLTPIPSASEEMAPEYDFPTSDSASDDFSIVEENFKSAADSLESLSRQRTNTSSLYTVSREITINNKTIHRKPPQSLAFGGERPMWQV